MLYSLAHQQQNGFKARDAFRMALLITVSIFIYQFFQMQQGDWLLYTIAFIYLGGVINGFALERALKRIYAAPLGFYFGFLFMGIFSYFDYRYTYLLPLFILLAFWYLFKTGEYGGFLILFLLFFMLFFDLNSKEYQDFNMVNLLLCRFFATFVGCLLIILGELFLFMPENLTQAANRQISEIRQLLSALLTTINQHYRSDQPLPNNYWQEIAAMNDALEKLHETIDAYSHEPSAEAKTVKELEHRRAACLKIYEGIRIFKLGGEATPPTALSQEQGEMAAQLGKALTEKTGCHEFAVQEDKPNNIYAVGLEEIRQGINALETTPIQTG